MGMNDPFFIILLALCTGLCPVVWAVVELARKAFSVKSLDKSSQTK